MSDLNEDLSQDWAAELTGSVGLHDDGSGDVPESLATDLAEKEAWQAEKDISVPNDVDDTRQGAADRAEEAEQQRPGKKVPLAALHEERTRRQALEVQLQAQAQQLQQLIAQQAAQQQAQLQAQQEAEIPDVEEDPVGWLKAKEKQFEQRLEQLQNGGQQPQHQQQAQQIEQLVMQEATVLAPVIADAEARFEAANPDYRQAFDHVQRTVDANMRAQHPGINEQQLGMLRTAALVTLAKQCQAQGVNVAEHVYQRAQAMGFQTASRAPRREPPTSLSNLSGSPRAPDEKGAISVAEISDMSDAEFDKYWNEMRGNSAVRPAV